MARDPTDLGSFTPSRPPGGVIPQGIVDGPVGDDGVVPAPRWRAWRPGYGVALALLLVAGDAMLYPGERGLTVGGKILLCIGTSLVVATFMMARLDVGDGRVTLSVAAVVGILFAAFSGDWFGGATEPPVWRDFVVPIVDVAVLAGALALWYIGQRSEATVLLVTGVMASSMIFYGQQDPPAWALLVGVASTWVFLAPAVGAWPRTIGIAAHALAVLGLAQAIPAWFTWTPYPFLTLFPAYLLLVYVRERHIARRVAWWMAVVVGALITLLGTSTLIGNWRHDLPLNDSILMLVLGGGVLAVFTALWWLARRPPADQPITTAEA